MIKYKISEMGLDSTVGEPCESVINDNQSTVNNSLENIQDVYNPILPQNVDIVRGLDEEIKKIEKETVKKQVVTFFNIFKDYYYNKIKLENLENVFTKLHLASEPESCVIEWNFMTFRAGFSFEDDEKDSSYYLVGANVENGEYISYSKLLKNTNYYIAIDEIVNYVIQNS